MCWLQWARGVNGVFANCRNHGNQHHPCDGKHPATASNLSTNRSGNNRLPLRPEAARKLVCLDPAPLWENKS